MMIDVENKVQLYEKDGEKYSSIGDGKEHLIVKNHWNDRDMVVLKLGKKRVTVSARDLEAAIKNSTNVNRYG